MKRPQSLFWPVLGVLLLAIAVGSLAQVSVVSQALIPLERMENRNRAERVARDVARELAQLSAAPDGAGVSSVLSRHRATLGRQAWLGYRDAAGRLTVVPAAFTAPLARALGPRPVAGDTIVDSTFADEPRRVDVLAVLSVSAPGGRGGPPGQVLVFEPTRPRTGVGIGQLELLMLPIQLLLAAVAGLILLQTLVRPLRSMERFATRVAGGDFAARLNDESKDELGRLSRQLDLMASRLEHARDDLAETEQQRRQLFADITHELATPLTSIRGYAATLRDPNVTVSDAERSRYLLGIHEEAERMARLVRDLFELARLEAGAAPLERERIEWGGLCGNTVDRFAKPFRDAHLALTWTPPRAECWIVADGHRIVQVLENLLGNALRYVPPGGAVHVTLSPARGPAGRHALRVEDNGPGVPAADLPHLFERFYRGADTRGGDGRRGAPVALVEGTGLGLAIARELVLGHDGLARAESVTPHGLAVIVELPAAAAPNCHGTATSLPSLLTITEQEVTS